MIQDQSLPVVTKRKRGRPRKYPVKQEQAARIGRPPRVVDESLVRPGPKDEWADYSDVTLTIMTTEIVYAMEHMLGMSRGLVRQSFLGQAKKVLDKYYPKLRKSAIHKAVVQEDGFSPSLAAVPVACRHRIGQIVRLCDLIETMVIDGVIK